MDAVIDSMLRGLPVLLGHLGLAFTLFAASCAAYLWVTPHDDLKLVRDGNVAAGVSLGAAFVGLALPLAFALAGSVNAFDLLLWGGLILIVQIATFRIVDLLLPGLPSRLEQGDMAAAMLLAGLKLAVATLNAAAIAG